MWVFLLTRETRQWSAYSLVGFPWESGEKNSQPNRPYVSTLQVQPLLIRSDAEYVCILGGGIVFRSLGKLPNNSSYVGRSWAPSWDGGDALCTGSEKPSSHHRKAKAWHRNKSDPENVWWEAPRKSIGPHPRGGHAKHIQFPSALGQHPIHHASCPQGSGNAVGHPLTLKAGPK